MIQFARPRYMIPLIILLGLLAAGAGYYVSSLSNKASSDASHIPGLYWPDPRTLHAFLAFDQHGEPFELEDMLGKWSFVFFGYTHCPDICPMTLSVMARLGEMLDNQPEFRDYQMIFVTVDPERDTAGRLAEYTGYFDPDFIGLGGSSEHIQTLSSQIGVVFMANRDDSNKENYLVDHSSSIFLIDPEGRLVGKFSAPHQPDRMLAQYRRIRDFLRNNG